MQSADFVSYDDDMFDHVCDALAEIPEPPGYLKTLPSTHPATRLLITRGDSTVWDEKNVDAATQEWDGREIPFALLDSPVTCIDFFSDTQRLQIWEKRGMLYLVGDMELSEFELTDPIDNPRGVCGPSNLVGLSKCYIECRSKDMFIEWVGYLARRLPVPSWVVDSNGVLWPALDIDPNELRL